jgi:DNA-binding MarR family transcriptional regulator
MTRRQASTSDAVWRRFVALITDTRDEWRQKMSLATGLPFGRIRALRRLVDGPLTLRELADAVGTDAPATTVLVNDLERRGLIARDPHPTNRRAKLVSLTSTGRELAARARTVVESAPPAFAAVSPEDLAALSRVVETLLAARGHDSPQANKPK